MVRRDGIREPYAQKVEMLIEVHECGEPGIAFIALQVLRPGIAIVSADVIGVIDSLVSVVDEADSIFVDRESYLRSIADVLLEFDIPSRIDVDTGDGRTVDMVVDWRIPVRAEIQLAMGASELTDYDFKQLADLFRQARLDHIDPTDAIGDGMHVSPARAAWLIGQAQSRGLIPGPKYR